MTVPDENGECLVPGLGKVVGPIPVRERFGGGELRNLYFFYRVSSYKLSKAVAVQCIFN